MTWEKYPYGGERDPNTGEWRYPPGRWMITDGACRLEVHLTIDGTPGHLHSLKRHPKGHPDGRNYIVSPEQADAYAEKILTALNGVQL